jgi:MFS family permease
MKAWLRTALTFGIASAVLTLLFNWLGNATASGDACHRSSPLGLLGFVVFLGLMGATGYVTTRAGDTVGRAAVAGLVAALISAVGTVIGFAIIFASINASQCVANNNTGISSQTLVTTGGIVAAIFISLIGLGVGAGMGAIGGLIGRRPATTAV